VKPARAALLLGGIAAALIVVVAWTSTGQSPDPLPSWNDGPARQAIIDFVTATSTPGEATFVPQAERIATFDQDGPLWVEHPL